MLALDVKLLTNKLQKQTLDESPTNSGAANIKLIGSDVGLKLSESAQAKLGASSSGKQVWTMPLKSEPQTINSGDMPLLHGAKGHGFKSSNIHKKGLYTTGGHCDMSSASNMISERPKKRHCNSMCVPPETEISIPPAKSTWQPQGSGLWRPVGMNNVRNCSRAGLDGKFDIRTVRWSPTECKNYKFSSLAPSVQRHRETGHITPDDLSTPPESPVSRPNSVYSDGAISPYTGEHYVDYTYSRVQQIQDFRNRSLSVEDKISFPTQTLTGPTGSGSINSMGQNNSVPSSPHHRYRIPRCRSQPTFYDRKSGRRRRRDLRPTLNFHKMMMEGKGSRLESTSCLTTIASSPRDSDMLPHCSLEHRANNSPIHELDTPSCDMSPEERNSTGNSAPVELPDDEDQDENDMEVFQLTEELDLEQIENH